MAELAEILEEAIEEVEAPKSADETQIDLGRERNKRKTKAVTPSEPTNLTEQQQILPTFEGVILDETNLTLSGSYYLSPLSPHHQEWMDAIRMGRKFSITADVVCVTKAYGQRHDKDWNGLEGRQVIALKLRAITGVFFDD